MKSIALKSAENAPMPDYRAKLMAKAFRVIPGTDYNRVLEEYLEGMAEIGFRRPFYELVLKENETWGQFSERSYPLFARFMKNRSIDPETPVGVTVALFFGNLCFLLEAQQFINVLSELEGLDAPGLHSRILQWLEP
ncbi:MAG: STAUR_1299 family protein [Terriglobia bacterium]